MLRHCTTSPVLNRNATSCLGESVVRISPVIVVRGVIAS